MKEKLTTNSLPFIIGGLLLIVSVGLLGCDKVSDIADTIQTKLMDQHVGYLPEPDIPPTIEILDGDGIINADENAKSVEVQIKAGTEDNWSLNYHLEVTNGTLAEETTGTMILDTVILHLTAEASGTVEVTGYLSDKNGNITPSATATSTAELEEPSVVRAYPPNGSGLAPTEPLQIVFSEAMDTSEITIINIEGDFKSASDEGVWDSYDDGSGITNNRLTLSPVSSWQSGTVQFDLQVKTAIGTLVKDAQFTYSIEGYPSWAATALSGNSAIEIFDVAVSVTDQVVIAGYVAGTGTYALDAESTITLAGGAQSTNAFVAQYDSTGIPQWAISVGVDAEEASVFNRIAVDSNGNVYAAGFISGTATYDFGSSVTVAGIRSGSNPILVKYDSTGSALWAKTTAASPHNATYSALGVSNDGVNVYAAGILEINDEFDFGNSVKITGAYAGDNAFVVCYDEDGVPQWGSTLASAASASAYHDLTVSKDGRLYLVGRVEGSSTFDFGNSITLAAPHSGKNPFLIKINQINGTAEWVSSLVSSSGDAEYLGVAAPKLNVIYVSGYISGTGTTDFGSSQTHTGANDEETGVVALYDSTGTLLWANGITTAAGASRISTVAGLTDGSVVFGGSTSQAGYYYFDESTTLFARTFVEGTNMLIGKYENNGSLDWVRSAVDAEKDISITCLATSTNLIIAGGVMYGTSVFDFGNDVTLTGINNAKNMLVINYVD